MRAALSLVVCFIPFTAMRRWVVVRIRAFHRVVILTELFLFGANERPGRSKSGSYSNRDDSYFVTVILERRFGRFPVCIPDLHRFL